VVGGRRVALSSQRGFTDLLRQRTSENTGRMERDLLATSALLSLLTPVLHCLFPLLSPGTVPIQVWAPVWSKALPVPF